MMKNKEKNDDSAYAEWIQKEWIAQGGLIQPQIAAGILNVSIARIKQMRDEGKLKEYKDPNGKIMLSFSEVMEAQNNKLKDYLVTYDLEVENNTGNTELKRIEKVLHQTKPPQKEQVISEEKWKHRELPPDFSIQIYNVKITQVIE